MRFFELKLSELFITMTHHGLYMQWHEGSG